MHARVPDYLPTSPFQTVSEGSFSETHGSKPPHQHTVYSRQSTVTPYFCFLLAGHSHICCEDLLRGATGCYSPVAGELVLCSAARTTRSTSYTGQKRPLRFQQWSFSETRFQAYPVLAQYSKTDQQKKARPHGFS